MTCSYTLFFPTPHHHPSSITTPKLRVRASVDTSALTAPLPRLGLQLNLPRTFASATWQGAGPHECYPDRKESAIMACHRAPAPALYVPYTVPGENGSRTDVSWLQVGGGGVEGEGGSGGGEATAGKALPSLRVDSPGTFNFSLQPYTTEDLAIATHHSELEAHPRGFLCLNLDAFLMGVGGDDSWTACVHEQHMLPPERLYEFEFVFSFPAFEA